MRAEHLGLADPGAQEDRRRPVGARGQDRRARPDAQLLAVAPRNDLDPVVVRREAVAERAVDHAEVGPPARRVEVRERGVDADASLDVDRLRAEADAAVEVVEIVRTRKPERRSRVEAGPVERPDLVLGVVPDAEPLDRAREERPQRVRAPGLVPDGAGPAVVVLRAADRDDAAVVRGAAADHPGARQLDRPAQGVQVARVVAPGVGRGERASVEEVGGPGSRVARPVVGPGLEQDHLRLALGREPPGDDAAGRPAAEHHDVALEPLHGASISRRASESRRSARAGKAAGEAARLRSPALLAQLVEHLHGKEGVDGSSPSEGFDVLCLLERSLSVVRR